METIIGVLEKVAKLELWLGAYGKGWFLRWWAWRHCKPAVRAVGKKSGTRSSGRQAYLLRQHSALASPCHSLLLTPAQPWECLEEITKTEGNVAWSQQGEPEISKSEHSVSLLDFKSCIDFSCGKFKWQLYKSWNFGKHNSNLANLTQYKGTKLCYLE